LAKVEQVAQLMLNKAKRMEKEAREAQRRRAHDPSVCGCEDC
jgi:hypothetical protein